MSKKIFILILVMIMTSGILKVSAQSVALDQFYALQSYGQIPQDFLNSIQGIAPPVDGSDRVTSRKEAKGSEKFKLRSDYYMNELLTGGHVVFGDPIGTFVNQVADTLLAAHPDLRSQLRFYITKSVAANAYSTDQGIIFINIGLIARVKNEAQLAYIIAHEIVHYVKKHNITIFLEEEKAYGSKRRNNEYQDLSVSEKLMRVNFRSKEIETLADHDALVNYFAGSSYDVEEVEPVFDVLLYSAYPFTNNAFNLSLLETKDMVLPDYYLIDDVEKLKVNENEADSMSTHPNVRKRKAQIRTLIDSLPEAGTLKFVHSQSEFSQVVALARFEVLRQLLIDHQLVEALFCSASLLQEFPDNIYVKKCFAASLYGISAYKTSGEASDIIQGYKEVAGEMGQVNYMVTKLNRRDLNILALNYTWRLKQEMPGDAYVSAISDDLFSKLVNDNSIDESFFYTKTLAELKLEQTQTAVQDTNTNNTRHRKKKTGNAKLDTTFTKFAFIDLLKEPAFVNEFQKWEDKRDSIKKVDESRHSSYSSFPAVTGNKTKKRDRVRISHVVMSEPYTVKVDTRKRDQVKYQESAMSAARVKELIFKNASRVGIGLTMADAGGLGEQNVKEFNEMAFVNEYVLERFSQSKEGMMNSFCKPYIDSIMLRNSTSYLGWMGISSVQRKKPVFKLCVLSIMPYLWPYTIYQFVTPKIHSSYYYVLFNVETGNVVKAGSTNLRTDLYNDQMNSHIYDFMYNIRKTYEK